MALELPCWLWHPHQCQTPDNSRARIKAVCSNTHALMAAGTAPSMLCQMSTAWLHWLLAPLLPQLPNGHVLKTESF